MILSVDFTPAWQQVVVFDTFTPSKVNRAREVHWCASGKVLNAARALQSLGGPCKALAPMGGTPGQEIRWGGLPGAARTGKLFSLKTIGRRGPVRNGYAPEFRIPSTERGENGRVCVGLAIPPWLRGPSNHGQEQDRLQAANDP